jgi:hypothetical protein
MRLECVYMHSGLLTVLYYVGICANGGGSVKKIYIFFGVVPAVSAIFV